VQSQQINAQAPFELAGKQSTTVHVEYQGLVSQTAQIQVQGASPDLFHTAPFNPNQAYPPPQGAIFNQDGSPNSPSNPAAVGSTVWILGTGGGVFTPPLPTGTLAPISPLSYLAPPVTVIIDSTPAQVTYAGSSPTVLSGVFQINFVVPPVPAYQSVHLIDATIGSWSASQQVSIAIKQ
jgi:uncharacterized protein (TIGR03437 family)